LNTSENLIESPTSPKKTQRFSAVKSSWKDEGQSPDYRFTLANERTYLAWIRTALALLAGAVGIDQLTPELASPLIRALLASCLCVCSGLLAIFAYLRWAQNEKAMRNNQSLPYTHFLKVISVTMIMLTTLVAIVIFL
jgi:putative membrane protein